MRCCKDGHPALGISTPAQSFCKRKAPGLAGALFNHQMPARSACLSLPLPAPAKQAKNAEAGGEERESGWKWHCRCVGRQKDIVENEHVRVVGGHPFRQ
jgi:hypothetical protein